MTVPVSTALQLGVTMLRVGVAAFGEHGEPCGDCGLPDIRTVVESAQALIGNSLRDGDVDGRAFDALDVLTLVGHALASESGSPSNGLTVSPICGALRVAVQLLDGESEGFQSS